MSHTYSHIHIICYKTKTETFLGLAQIPGIVPGDFDKRTYVYIYIMYIPAFPTSNDIHIHIYIQIMHLPGIPRAVFYIYTQIYLPGIPRAALYIILYRNKTYTQTCISLAFRGPQDHVSFPHSGSVALFYFYISDQHTAAVIR